MFILSTISDTIKVRAAQLGLDQPTAIKTNINAKYANRVLPGVGLCIAHFDFSAISEGHIKFGDGCTYYKCTFRLVVFRPFKGEVLMGKVKSCDETSIRLTLGFFDDIYVDWTALPPPCGYDRSDATWFTVPEPTEAEASDALLSPPEKRWYIDRHDWVRFAVEDDEFNEPEPPQPRGPAAGQGSTQGRSGAVPATGAVVGQAGTPGVGVDGINMELANRVPLFKVHASLLPTGLGPLSWWRGQGEQEAVEEEYAAE